MTEKTTYWVQNGAGQKAFLTGADARDHWAFHGWSPTGEPGDDFRGFVWMTHPDVGQPAPIAWEARAYWMGIGFEPSPPAEPVNPTKDPALTDVPVDKPVDKPEPKKTTTTATAAPKNEEA